jgi:Concanavalin A-like lectin/glucanases superfamily
MKPNCIWFAVALVLLVVDETTATLTATWNAAVAASNPLNWYRLDDASGNMAFDAGTDHRNGTYGSGAIDAIREVPGLVGKAVRFGNQSTIFLSAPDLTGDWTAEFVLKRIGSKRSSVLIRGVPFEFPSQALKLEQFENTGQVGFTQYGQVDATFTPPVFSPLDEWIHLVYVNRIGSGLSLYLNGELAGSHPSNINLPRDQIGSWSDTVPESPFAIMDEVVLYNRALTGSEIAAHFAAVPEPGSCLLAILSLFAISCQRRR